MLRFFSTLIILITMFQLQGCSKIIGMTTDGPLGQNEGERSTGSFIDDEIIETKLLVNLDKASQALAESHINVTSYNGIVLLTGQVTSQDLRQQAAEIASRMTKVRRVHNELHVSGSSSVVARSNDSWLTSKVKSKMFFNAKIPGGRIKVVTENGVVYLMGLLTREEGQRAADLVRQTGGVQKVVILFEYIANSAAG